MDFQIWNTGGLQAEWSASLINSVNARAQGGFGVLESELSFPPRPGKAAGTGVGALGGGQAIPNSFGGLVWSWQAIVFSIPLHVGKGKGTTWPS